MCEIERDIFLLFGFFFRFINQHLKVQAGNFFKSFTYKTQGNNIEERFARFCNQ